ncbi:glycosyl hydrolase family 32 [Coraliomargarita sp. W4R72]
MPLKNFSLLAIVSVLTCMSAGAKQTPSELAASIEFYNEGAVDLFTEGAKLFTDRPFTLNAPPEALRGKNYLQGSIGPDRFRVTADGFITVLTPESNDYSSSQVKALEAAGFQRVEEPKLFQVFGHQEWNQARIYRKEVKTGENYRFGKWTVILGFSSAKKYEPLAWNQNQGELLYNGIRLPKEWPPQDIDPSDKSPMPVPYLDFPPKIVPIDVGRQLFVDDFLIESTDLNRNFHMPRKYEGNPVLKPETPIELGLIEPEGHTKPYGHGNAGAGPKSGGCWWDPDDQVFKLWYETSWFGPIAMATSKDGLNWERPEFDIRPGTNIVSPVDLTPDSGSVVRNWDATNPKEKWTMYMQPPGTPRPGVSMTSEDGIHWGNRVETGVTGDRSTHFYNPFRKKWVYSLRTGFPGRGRARQYYECDDFIAGAKWSDENKVAWAMTDELDPPAKEVDAAAQLYNLDAVAYESIMLGIFEIHRGLDNKACLELGIPKTTELNFAYSRDGFHWHRPDRRAHIPAERKDVWDRGYVQSLGNVCTIVGDNMLFYYIGYRGNKAKAGSGNSMYDHSATGVAILRRDGFASMDAGANPASLTTRPVTFSGKHLFVNVDSPQGTLRAELLDDAGNPIEPFTLENCLPITADSTLEPVKWKHGSDLSALSGKPMRFRFELANGSLYSFWVSQDTSGRSDGYIAGGGPGYNGPTDTVGKLK